jgi:hypothetical protein
MVTKASYTSKARILDLGLLPSHDPRQGVEKGEKPNSLAIEIAAGTASKAACPFIPM